jgi:cytidylate kinase
VVVHEPVSDFVVLLVGGASGSGKTMLARPLARALGVNLTEVDDIQIALEAATTERELPLLHFGAPITRSSAPGPTTDASHTTSRSVERCSCR